MKNYEYDGISYEFPDDITDDQALQLIQRESIVPNPILQNYKPEITPQFQTAESVTLKQEMPKFEENKPSSQFETQIQLPTEGRYSPRYIIDEKTGKLSREVLPLDEIVIPQQEQPLSPPQEPITSQPKIDIIKTTKKISEIPSKMVTSLKDKSVDIIESVKGPLGTAALKEVGKSYAYMGAFVTDVLRSIPELSAVEYKALGIVPGKVGQWAKRQEKAAKEISKSWEDVSQEAIHFYEYTDEEKKAIEKGGLPAAIVVGGAQIVGLLPQLEALSGVTGVSQAGKIINSFCQKYGKETFAKIVPSIAKALPTRTQEWLGHIVASTEVGVAQGIEKGGIKEGLREGAIFGLTALVAGGISQNLEHVLKGAPNALRPAITKIEEGITKGFSKKGLNEITPEPENIPEPPKVESLPQKETTPIPKKEELFQYQTAEPGTTEQPMPNAEFLEKKGYEPATVLNPNVPIQSEEELRKPTGGREIPLKDSQLNAMVDEALHMLKFGDPDQLTQQRLKEFPASTTVGHILGMLAPMIVEGAGVSKAASQIPQMVKLSKMAKIGKVAWGKIANTALQRSVIGLTDAILRERENLISPDLEIRENSKKNLLVKVTAMAASAIPQGVLPRGMIQPLAQMFIDGLAQTALNKEAWERENLASTMTSMLAAGVFAFNDVKKLTVNKGGINVKGKTIPEINVKQQIEPSIKPKIEQQVEPSIKTKIEEPQVEPIKNKLQGEIKEELPLKNIPQKEIEQKVIPKEQIIPKEKIVPEIKPEDKIIKVENVKKEPNKPLDVLEEKPIKQEKVIYKEGANVGEFTSLEKLKTEAEKTGKGILEPEGSEEQYQQRWRTPSKMRTEMPELVELYKGIGEGQYPKVYEKLNDSAGRVLGLAQGKKIFLRGDIFIGPLRAAVISKGRQRDIEIAFVKDKLIKSGIEEKNIIIKEDQGAAKIYERDPNFAEQVFAHEIGHVLANTKHIGEDPNNKSLGAIVSGVGQTVKDYIASFPGSRKQPLTPGEKIRLENIARLKLRKNYEEIVDKEITEETDFTPQEILDIWNQVDQSKIDPKLSDYIKRLDVFNKKSIVLEALKGRISPAVPKKQVVKGIGKVKITKSIEGTPAQIAKKYHELIVKEVENRELIDLNIMKHELKRFTRIWKDFDPNEDPSYTKYRYKPSELYADAVSGILVHPELIARQAPTFYKGFLNYMENRPELKEAWEKIQLRNQNPEEVLKNRSETIRENYAEAEQIRKKQWEERLKETKLPIWDNIKEIVYEKNQPLYKIKRQVEKKLGRKLSPEEDPTMWLSENQYVPGQIKGMISDVDNIIKKPLSSEGLTMTDLGEYMDYQRIIHELPDKAASEGMQPQYAEKQLDYMKAKLGDKKYAILEKAADDFWNKVRTVHIIPELAKSDMFDDPLINKIKSNKFYSKNTITEFLEDKYGKPVTKSLMPAVDIIKSIHGSLKAKANPFVETVLQDAVLLQVVHRNSTHKSVIKFLKEYVPDEVNSHSKDLKEVHYIEKGKLVTNSIDNEIAKLLETDAQRIGTLMKFYHNVVAAPIKQILTQKNPWFIMRNAIRDPITLAQNIPQANLRMAIAYTLGSYKEAWNEVQGKEMSKAVRDMYKNKALIAGRTWKSSDIMSGQDELERMAINFAQNEPAKNRLIAKTVGRFIKLIEDAAQTTEKAPKIAGWKILEKTAPQMSAKERAYIVRTQVGSPDFYRGGTARMLLNNIFLFSNANMQGWRGAYEGFQKNKGRFIMKMMLYNITPKVLMFAAKAGMLTFLGAEFGKKMKEAYEKIPDYQLARYGAVIPFAETESGKIWFAKIPTDFTGQAVGSMFWHLMNTNKDAFTNGNVKEDIQNTINEFVNQTPFSSIHPFFKSTGIWGTYLSGNNPNDPYYYTPIINPKIYGTKIGSELVEMAKWTGEQFGSSIWWKIPDNYDLRKKDKFEKLLGMPIVGSFINTFIGLSDASASKESKELVETIKKEKIESLEKSKAMEEHFNRIGSYKKAEVNDLFRQLKRKGIIPKSKNIAEFKRQKNAFHSSYKNMITSRAAEPGLQKISRAPTLRERSVLVKEYLDRKGLEGIERKRMERRLMNRKKLMRLINTQLITDQEKEE